MMMTLVWIVVHMNSPMKCTGVEGINDILHIFPPQTVIIEVAEYWNIEYWSSWHLTCFTFVTQSYN